MSSGGRAGSKHDLVVPNGMPIQWLEIFRGRFVVAFTASALLLLDSDTGASSHVPWRRAGDERFCMDWPLVSSRRQAWPRNVPACACLNVCCSRSCRTLI